MTDTPIVNMDEERKKRTSKGEKKKKPSRSEWIAPIFSLLARDMDPMAYDKEVLGVFPYSIGNVNQKDLILIDNETNTCRTTTVQEIGSILNSHLWTRTMIVGSDFPWQFDHKTTYDIISDFISKRLCLQFKESPRAFCTRNEPDLCFFRSEYDPDMNIRDLDSLEFMAPMWHSVLKRMTNADSFAKSIGRIYDPLASRKQAVWIVGESDTGKSQLLWFIGHLVGGDEPGNGAHHVVGANDLSEKWWTANAVGKRIISTCEANPEFLRGEHFKSLTGDNFMSVEAKKIQPYLVKNELLFYFYSNKNPEISGEADFRNRIIMCVLSPFKDEKIDEHEYREILKSEAEPFLGYCRNMWLESRGRISADMAELDAVIAEREDIYISLFNGCFAIDKNEAVRSDLIHEKISANYRGKLSARAFVNFWVRRFGLKYERRKVSSPGDRTEGSDRRSNVGYYVGLRLLTSAESGGYVSRTD